MKAHIFTGRGKRPYAMLAIQSALMFADETHVWFNDKDDEIYIPMGCKKHYVKDELNCYAGSLDDARSAWKTKRPKSLAPYSDIIRLEILQKYGGLWMDDDVVLLRPTSEFVNGNDFYCATDPTYNRQNEFNMQYPTNYCLYAPKGSETVNEMIELVYRMKKETEPGERRYQHFGPYMLYKYYSKRKDNAIAMDQILPVNSFIAIGYLDVDRYMKPMHRSETLDTLTTLRNCYGLHLSDIRAEKIKQNSILQTIFTAIQTGKSNIVGHLFDTYYEVHNDFFDKVDQYHAGMAEIDEVSLMSLNQINKFIK